MSDRALDDFIEYYSQDRILLQRPERDKRKAAGTPALERPEHDPNPLTTSDTFPSPERKPR